MRIEIDMLPPIQCSPNYRGHWSETYRASREYEVAVFYKCIDLRNRFIGESKFRPFRVARLNLTCVFARRRIRDADNLLARFKPGLDALVMAGFILGDDMKHLHIGTIVGEIDSARAPKTIIELIDEEVIDDTG